MRRTRRARPLPPVLVSATLAAAALSTTGCLRDPDPIAIDDRAPAVYAVLHAGAESADVLITRAGRWDQSPGYVGISGADVRLVHGADTARAVEDPDRACAGLGGGYYAYGPTPDAGYADGCYHAELAAPIARGEAYELIIDLPSGQRVTGRTRVPIPPTLVRPEPGLTVTAACGNPDPQYCYGRYHEDTRRFDPVAAVPLEWEPATADTRYAVRVRGLVAFLDGVGYEGGCVLGYGFGDAEVEAGHFAIPNIGCEAEALAPARFDSIQAEALVATLGDGYAAFLDALAEGQTVRGSAVSEGLSGAFGVFGAVAPARRSFTVVRDPAPPPAAGTTP